MRRQKITVVKYVDLYRQGCSKKQIAREIGMNERGLYRFIKTHSAEIEALLSQPPPDVYAMLRQAMNSEPEPEPEPQEPAINPKEYLVPSEARVDHTTDQVKLKIGIIADTHLCSKHQQLSFLNDYYRWAYDQGVRDIYHAGDMLAGADVYPGQSNDLIRFTQDEQVDYAVEYYPRIEGVTTHIISGNHDLVFIKRKGGDPLRTITLQRPDINYLGQFSAWVKLQEGCLMYLLHPDGGSAYADSYRLQKLIESFEGGNKPNIAVMGHFHRRGYISSRNVHGFLGACFEGQTDFLRRKAVQPVIGGTILEIDFTDHGAIQDIGVKFRQYLVPKEKDY
jgi:predicted phosphodiesterase